MEKVKVKTEGKSYPIYIESGLFKDLPGLIKEKHAGKKLALISDHNVYSLYGHEFLGHLSLMGFDAVPIVFDAGEANKTLSTLTSFYHRLADASFTRSDIIIALGGGVTGDMAGFAAATFLRGMGFIQVPTTLLAMVDSSIGGKVAVDLPQGKNLVGAFYQPDAVYADPALLSSLSGKQFSDGMAELVKHGLIRDKKLARLLSEAEPSDVRNTLMGIMDEVVAKSCKIKRDVVEEDEKDNGIRQILNFGHTIGHGIERVQNYCGLSHGEAVSIGMVAMTRITERMGLTRKGESERISKILALYGLPVSMPALDAEALISAIRLDKKNRSGKITIAYIEEIGEGRLLELDLKELEERIYGELKDSFCAT